MHLTASDSRWSFLTSFPQMHSTSAAFLLVLGCRAESSGVEVAACTKNHICLVFPTHTLFNHDLIQHQHPVRPRVGRLVAFCD
ncbi:hypothetical protein DFH08DRAFT_904115, partial [Mycena albidolilacea]